MIKFIVGMAVGMWLGFSFAAMIAVRADERRRRC